MHGYPQTHVLWHKLAPGLARHFTVVATDLRGYGDSSKPPAGDGHQAYSKRTMAQDQIEVMAALGHDSFRVVGHDRGARVAYRMALDDPGRVERLALLDIIPTLEQFERADQALALRIYHWYFLAQPAPLPETLIGARPDYYLSQKLLSWSESPDAFAPEAMAEYQRCFADPETIRATCEDYRAGASVDCAHDRADRERGNRITCPLLVLWGERGRGHMRRDVLGIWRDWADDVRGRALPCGHFLPEEAPEETLTELLAFLDG